MDPREQTLGAVLERMAAAQGARTAVLFQEQARSYAELAQESRRLAGGLAALGLRTGEHLAVWLPSDLDWVLLELAAARLGLVLVPISRSAWVRRARSGSPRCGA
jgi:acyl-CoA synthetase (AMP-forming)/AMP-acid ligase II